MTAPASASPAAGSLVTRAAWALLIAAAVGALFVYATRVSSWQSCWRWAITEGREGQTIYAIWRVVHGAPLYTPPNEEPYSLTYLNFGFYWAYGAICRAFRSRACSSPT